MVPHDQFDDLGDEGGTTFDDYGGFAREAVARWWQVMAVGQRPVDWAKRDLVYGRARSDRRNWQLRKLLHNKPPFLYVGIEALPQDRMGLVAQARAFQFIQYLKLFRLLDEAEQPLLGKVKKILNCPTSLFQVAPPSRLPLRNCQLAHLCPSCMSRTAADIFDHIGNTILTDEEPRILISLKVTKDLSFVDSADIAKEERKIASKKLKQIAKILGADGGLLTFQISPTIAELPTCEDGEVVGSYNKHGLRFHASLVVALDRSLEPRYRNHISDLTLHEMPEIQSELAEYGLSAAIATSRNPYPGQIDGLRYVLFGKPRRVTDTSEEKPILGAFANHQFHLASHAQWSLAEAWTRSMKLYSYFGNWKTHRAPRQKQFFVNANARTGRKRQLQSLSRANYKRQSMADSIARRTTAQINEVYVQLTDRIGREPGRQKLRMECRERGIELTERETRRALKILKGGINVTS